MKSPYQQLLDLRAKALQSRIEKAKAIETHWSYFRINYKVIIRDELSQMIMPPGGLLSRIRDLFLDRSRTGGGCSKQDRRGSSSSEPLTLGDSLVASVKQFASMVAPTLFTVALSLIRRRKRRKRHR